MKDNNYHKTITAQITAEEAFKNIANVAAWWTSHVQGSAANLNDTFRTTFGENWFSYKVIESLPGKRLVWLVTDCYTPWLDDKQEWKGTKIVWDIAEDQNRTTIDLTHVGLVPDVECYNVCNTGWNKYLGESLPKFIETGKGILFDD